MAASRLSRRALLARGLVAAGVVCGARLATVAAAWADAPRPAELAPALLAKIKLIGHAQARLTTGTQVRVSGYVMNTDAKQHDAYLAATLLDAHGHVVGRAAGKAEDLKPHKKTRYSVIGSASAPRWATVKVKVTRVTENVAGEGTD